MAKRQRLTNGAILEIDLQDGHFCYAQINGDDFMFYDIYVDSKLQDITVLTEKEPLFFLGVYDYVVTKGRWLKVGKLPIKEEHKVLPHKFIQDKFNFEIFRLYNTNTGVMTNATREECIGLEKAAVWEGEHVEERLRDHYAGKKNRWVELLSMKG